MTHRQLCLRPLAPLVCTAAGQAGGGRILAVAPTPSLAAKLPMWKLTAMLRRAGRRRGIETDAERAQQLFRQEAPRQLPLVEDAMGKQARALLQLDAACEAVDDRARATEKAFRTRPDAVITLSLPGTGAQVGARILGEIGDDRSRFASAAGLKAYAGSAPITRASGERRYSGRRFVRNNRLNHVGRLWAFDSLSGSSGADSHYRRRRAGRAGICRLCGTCSTGCPANESVPGPGVEAVACPSGVIRCRGQLGYALSTGVVKPVGNLEGRVPVVQLRGKPLFRFCRTDRPARAPRVR
ncbi:transposase [Streptomyces sp. NPDC002779]|uniref:transposase n=1 Tax=Streptomyces sp. NPDC002779 TaxID=3364664 RepID=UPI0036BDFF85